jgi:NADH-quinone oxidoreductase subunit G
MPQITIDGKLINADNGKTIIEAAYQNGMNIPHFCWHPELSVAGNCRMCLVEVGMPKKLPDGSFELDSNGKTKVQFFPKLQIACATQITDGMVVNTQNDKTIEAQEAVMEFLLINHPLDCPICDEAGECKLQEYAYKHSSGESRFIEEKQHKPKRVEWGPNVIYDAERCILCSRCIRYAKEVAKQDVLTFVNRGDHTYIKLFDDTQFDNPYSMNVIELCPVGALTSRDFRFKSRVWEMSFTDSICPGCSRGCNIKIGVRNNQILRLQPRTNMYVNRYWMCDYGRLTQYPFVNNERVTNNFINVNGNFQVVNFEEAKNKACELLKKFKPNEIMILGSAFCTNEDNFVIQKFAKQILKTKHIDFFQHIDENFKDNFLHTDDKTPNAKGALEIGIIPVSDGFTAETVASNINKKHIKALIIINDSLEDDNILFNSIDNLECLITLSTNHNKYTAKSDVVFAAATYAEVEGTFTNIDGRVQHFTPAVVTQENLSRMGMKMSRWDKFGSFNDHWTQKDKRDARPIWKIIMGIANSFGGNLNYKNAEDIFADLSSHMPSFNGMNYELLDTHQGIVLNQSKRLDPILVNYVSHYMKP